MGQDHRGPWSREPHRCQRTSARVHAFLLVNKVCIVFICYWLEWALMFVAFKQMGIQGLLPLLKSITEDVHLSQYANTKVAVDALCWST